MAFADQPEFVPLHEDAHGILRIGNTRVPLEAVIYSYLFGSNAEEIVDQYSALDLADVYSVIAYYLRHRAEVDAYVLRQKQQEDQIRQEAAVRWDQTGLRERLLARAAHQAQ